MPAEHRECFVLQTCLWRRQIGPPRLRIRNRFINLPRATFVSLLLWSLGCRRVRTVCYPNHSTFGHTFPYNNATRYYSLTDSYVFENDRVVASVVFLPKLLIRRQIGCWLNQSLDGSHYYLQFQTSLSTSKSKHRTFENEHHEIAEKWERTKFSFDIKIWSPLVGIFSSTG